MNSSINCRSSSLRTVFESYRYEEQIIICSLQDSYLIIISQLIEAIWITEDDTRTDVRTINTQFLHVINILKLHSLSNFFFLWRCDPTRVMTSSLLRFLDHTQRRATVDRTPPDEWSARRIDLYLTKHNTHNRQTCMPPVGFEPTISAGEQP